MKQHKQVDFDNILNVICSALAQSPFPVVLTTQEYRNQFEHEIGAEGKEVAGQLHSFFQIESQLFDFLKRELQTYSIAVDLMTSNNKKLLENYGVQAVDEAKRIEHFVSSYSMTLMRETMRGVMDADGSARFYRLFISLIVYFIYKYPPLLNPEAFKTLKEPAQERLKAIGSSLISIIYRFNKDINPDNEPIQPIEKYIIWGIQKFLVGIGLKLPQNIEEEGYQQGTIYHTIRYASQLNHYHLQRTKIVQTSPHLIVMEIIKAIETHIDLNNWLWENKSLDEERIIEGIEYCNKSIQETFDELKVWVRIACNNLLERWITENLSYITQQKDSSDKEIAAVSRSYKIITSAAIGGKHFFTEGKQIIQHAFNLYDKILKSNMHKLFSGLGTEYLEAAPIFHVIALYFLDDVEGLKKEMETTLALYEDTVGLYNRIIYVSRAPILRVSEDTKKQEFHDSALYVSDKMIEEEQVEELKISLEDLEEFNFQSGNIEFSPLPTSIHTILGDSSISDEINIQFSRLKADTKTQTLRIGEGDLKKLTNSLPYTSGKVSNLNYNMQNQSILLDDQGLLAVITIDNDKKIDGLLFSLQLKLEENEAMTTITTPEGSRQGAPRKITLQTLESIHLYGLANTDGPLGKQKISVKEYIQKFLDKDNFEKAKLYHLKVPGGLMSLVKFD